MAALAWMLASPNRSRAQSPGGPAARYVPRGGNLQQALDAANPGDTILLEAGATYTGNFLLRAKQGDGTITIASRASDALPEGVRVGAAESRFMPKLLTPNGEPALWTEDRAHDYLATPAAACCVVRLLERGLFVRMNPLQSSQPGLPSFRGSERVITTIQA